MAEETRLVRVEERLRIKIGREIQRARVFARSFAAMVADHDTLMIFAESVVDYRWLDYDRAEKARPGSKRAASVRFNSAAITGCHLIR